MERTNLCVTLMLRCAHQFRTYRIGLDGMHADDACCIMDNTDGK